MTIDTSIRPDRPPQRAMIAHSWRRSELSGVRPDAAPPTTTVDIASADPLLDAARPVLDAAAPQLAETNMSLLLVDHECRMVTRVAFGSTVERALDDLGASPGIPFGEESVGTTALGTPAEVRGQVTVNGAEHYLDQFKHLSCFGQPIVHPATRRLAGILCMTEIADRINPLSVPFVTGIVSDIADRLLDRSRAHQRCVLDAFQRAAPRRDIAVAALGDDLQLTNALAAELLSPTDIGTLQTLAADPTLGITNLRMTLASGVETDVVVEPIAGAEGAALFRFRTISPADRPALTFAGTQPQSSGASIAVVGEPGTGRSTRALSVADEYGSTPIILDVADALIGGEKPDVIGMLAASRRDNRPLIVDGVDLLDDKTVSLLTRAAATADAHHPLILVSGPGAGAAVSALLSRCTSRVDLAPLRQRTAELAAIATSILSSIDADLRLSTPATDALLSQEWPGNLSELWSVLEHAAQDCRNRNTRVVDVAALPERYRTTSRAAHLSGREQAERQAIIDALDRAGRNKVHAARELGISRTTLYARMRALGI
ncbi:sigma-54-dependent Fis family transcriptional regulator [Gordonia sp. ABSL49_1]|uniref:sigma-54-dependent Fis family transcriptional regulator n=1 Tax=Gordonia sp. ABSL49_1 TaxID=2920941 RepID=UPI0035B2E1A1